MLMNISPFSTELSLNTFFFAKTFSKSERYQNLKERQSFLESKSVAHLVQKNYLCINSVFINAVTYIYTYRVHSFGVIWTRNSDPRSLGSWCNKETDESVTRVDSSVPLMHHDPSDLGSLILIQITTKEGTQMYIHCKHVLERSPVPF